MVRGALLVHVGSDHLGGDVGRERTPVAVFLQDDDHDLRIAAGNHAHKPRVGSFGPAFGVCIAAADDLGCSGFAGKIDAFNVGCGSRAGGGGGGHAVGNDGPRVLVEGEVFFSGAGKAVLNRLAEVGRDILVRHHHVGAYKMTAGSDAAHGARQLQRRHLRLTLANADGNRVAGVIPLVEVLHLPLRRGHDSGHLVGQVDAGLRAEAEGGGVFRDGVDAQFLSQRVEKSVAGERNGLFYIEYAVVTVAVEEAAVEGAPAHAIYVHILGHALLESGGRDDGVERLAESELILNGLVHQRMGGVIDELIPVVAVDAHGKSVGVVTGVGDHGQNFAVAGVHCYDRAV